MITLDAVQEFRTIMISHGLIPPEEIIADGKLHRCGIEGKPKSKDGTYLIFEDGLGGGFQNWTNGDWQDWHVNGIYAWTEEEKATHQAHVETVKKQREAEERKHRTEAREQSAQIWEAAPPCEEHAYLTRKGVQAHGTRLATEGFHAGSIIIPIRDVKGVLHSLQFIGVDGGKFFLPGGAVQSHYFTIGKPDPTICICEGFATGATIHEATGHGVVVAFNAGNLDAVGKAIRAKYPETTLIFCADDDFSRDDNPGKTRATEAAQHIGGRLVLPVFGSDRAKGQTDFNDMAQAQGIQAVRILIESVAVETSPLDGILHRKKGKAIKSAGNLAKILRLHKQWQGQLALNEMSQDIIFKGKTVDDTFIDYVQEQIEDTWKLTFGREEVASKILAQATANRIHPVKEMLLALPPWDETERIRRVAAEILGEPTPLAAQYILRSMVGAVRRVFQPGTKMDTLPVLIGPQGIYKSTFWRFLYGTEWFSDSPIDLDSKDGMMTIHRRWCTELSEIDHMTSTKAAERIKSFISSAEDIFRPPFSKSVRVFPRSCVLVGTANQQGFLVDPTGSRRFWPILVHGDIRLDLIQAWRDQLWAEALDIYHAGVEHWLPKEIDILRNEDSSRFEAEEPWAEEVEQAVINLSHANQSPSDGYSLSVLLTAMGVPIFQRTRSASMKLAGIMKAKGWTKERPSKDGIREWLWYPT